MKKVCLLLLLLPALLVGQAQEITTRLAKAYSQFERDSQLSNALISLYVIDGKTGAVVFDKNSRIGMAPASTQKIITSATAFALLGKDYRFKTSFYTAASKKEPGTRQLLVVGSGDPTLGSWRFAGTKDEVILEKLASGLQQKNISSLTGPVLENNDNAENDGIPEGYIWQDIGNYYGAGHFAFNWHENQYDMRFKTAASGPAEIVDIEPAIPHTNIVNRVTAGKKGSGDNAYIYFTPASSDLLIEGTIPPSQSAFSISGAMPQPVATFTKQLQQYMAAKKIVIKNPEEKITYNFPGIGFFSSYDTTLVYTHTSPALDSIVYWFLKKSINLYGEALLKTIGAETKKEAALSTGVSVLQKFWQAQNIPPAELNMYDGSGLSPANRVTTHAQVTVLQFAKKQNWFPAYIAAFPEYNKMKMKSGTIADVKAFAGYQAAANGREYIFSFIINNYNGASSSLVQKMYKVLDELK